MSDLCGSDSLLNLVNQTPCKARLSGSEISTSANYGEEAITIGAIEDDTFSVDHECCCASAMSVDQPSQSSLHTRDPCVGADVQTTGACHVNYALVPMLCCLSIESWPFF